MFLNPSLTGMYSGDYRLYLNYRNQWSAVGTKPWVTSALSYDMPYQRFGMGAFIMDNRAGTGGFNVLNFLLSGAYEITQDPKKYNHLSVGLQLGFIHKYFNPSNYVFDNQYSTANGGGFDNTLPVGETFTTTAIWLPESNMGVYYYNSNDQAKINPFGGFSLFHITSPKESFFGTDNRLPRRFVFHGGANFYPSDAITLVPIYLFMREKNVNELNIGILGYYNWNAGKSEDNNSKKSEIILIFGPTYRNKDAVVLHLGLIYKEFEYKVSYDINTSPLNTVSNYRGGFELSVIYKKPKTVRPPSLELY